MTINDWFDIFVTVAAVMGVVLGIVNLTRDGR